MPHEAVLLQEVIKALEPRSGGHYLDGTIGAGGHAAAILKASTPDGQLIGLDVDPEALAVAEQTLMPFKNRWRLRRANFTRMDEVVRELDFPPLDGILLDLGMSSMQLERAERGFAFNLDGPLDMRMDPDLKETAADLVNNLSADALADILFSYGEEHRSRRIAQAIVAARPIRTTTELAAIVARVVGGSKGARIHPATRTFQALRIAVNQELQALSTGLEQTVRLLRPGGRLAVISFHSLEDRIAKGFFKQESRDCICPPEQLVCSCAHRATLKILTPKPIRASHEEVAKNPRARSAKLRAAEYKG